MNPKWMQLPLYRSGPAYYFLFMEIFQKVAEELGLEKETARLLVLQTALGASKMALESNDTPLNCAKKSPHQKEQQKAQLIAC